MRCKYFSVIVLIAILCGSWAAGRLFSADPPEKSSSEDLAKIERQIAGASLKLAEVELQVLVDANQKLANTFPRSAVERSQQALALAKERAAQAGKDDDADLHTSYVDLTKSEWDVADANYRAAVRANKQIKDAVPRLEVERFRLLAELAKLRYDRAQQAGKLPEIVLLNWQVEDLRNQIRRLVHQVELYRGNE